jgi:drug/metabolite transporter (DMT)-like permease
MNQLVAAPRSLSSYIQLGLNVLAVATAEILLKMGATSVPTTSGTGIFNLEALGSFATWIGIGFYIAGFLLWLSVLRTMALSQAYSFSCLVYVAVPLGAWALLGETISLSRGFGILLVLSGCLLASSPAAMAEERL